MNITYTARIMSLSEYDWTDPEEFSDFTTLNNETIELPASKPYL